MEPMERADNFLPRVDDNASVINELDGRVVTITAPASAAAEQYRTLYYRLERLRELRPMKLVGFTSALPGEGKTLTAVNLALTAARANPERRILLVDTDLRRSMVAETLGVRNNPGLSDYLLGECELSETVRRFRSTKLAVVPGGTSTEEPTQLLASPRMKELLRSMRDNFEEIYIDLPPSLLFADAGILGCQTDGVVLVVRAGVTPGHRVTQAMESLAGSPLVGCVLNGAEQTDAPYLRSYNVR